METDHETNHEESRVISAFPYVCPSCNIPYCGISGELLLAAKSVLESKMPEPEDQYGVLEYSTPCGTLKLYWQRRVKEFNFVGFRL